MKSTSKILAVLLIASIAHDPDASAESDSTAAPTATPEQVLQLTADALAESPTLRFDFRVEETMGDKQTLFAGRGMTAAMDGTRRRILLDGAASDPSDTSAQPSRLVVSDDGAGVRVAAHGDGILWESPLYRAGGLLFQVWAGKFMNSLAAPEVIPPLIGLGPTVLDDQALDGVDCHVLQMPIPGGVTGTVLIGKADGLPRRALLEAEGFRSQSDFSNYKPESSQLSAQMFSVDGAGLEVKEFTLGGPPPGAAAPDFELEGPDGSSVRLADLKGKVVVLDFWATWCIPCRASMAGVQELYSEHGDRPFEVVSATYKESGDPAAFVEDLGITYPFYDGDSIAGDYGVDQSGLPTMFLIGPNGEILDYFYGYTGEESEARLRSAVEEALSNL